MATCTPAAVALASATGMIDRARYSNNNSSIANSTADTGLPNVAAIPAAAQTIRKGGTLKVGEYTLVVPAGALDRQVKITMQQVRDTVNSVRFGPEGLKFARSARLTMYYYNCRQLPGGREHKIAYVDESLRVLESPKSRDDEQRYEVSADIDHFSRYAVAW